MNPSPAPLPTALLYTTSARLGGSGLDVSSHQGALASHRAGVLRKVVAYANGQEEIPSKLVRSLAAHPVRLLSALGSTHYYGAKKHYLDWIATRELGSENSGCAVGKRPAFRARQSQQEIGERTSRGGKVLLARPLRVVETERSSRAHDVVGHVHRNTADLETGLEQVPALAEGN